MNPRSSNKRGLVLVTGGSGYVAGYCIAELLNNGWNVRTTVRSVAKARALRAGIGALASNASEIQVVEADLLSDTGWSKAAVGAQCALHVASPVPVTDPKNDDELVRPARDGTLRVLKAARDAGVKRVVMTSSISAIIYGRGARRSPSQRRIGPTRRTGARHPLMIGRRPSPSARRGRGWRRKAGDWSSSPSTPAWSSARCSESDFSASIEVVKKLLDGSIPALPRFGFNVVDVRDIARLHVLAMTTPQAAGERFIGSGDFYWMSDVARILREGLGDKAKKVPSIPVPDFVARMAALFDPIEQHAAYCRALIGQDAPSFPRRTSPRLSPSPPRSPMLARSGPRSACSPPNASPAPSPAASKRRQRSTSPAPSRAGGCFTGREALRARRPDAGLWLRNDLRVDLGHFRPETLTEGVQIAQVRRPNLQLLRQRHHPSHSDPVQSDLR